MQFSYILCDCLQIYILRFFAFFSLAVSANGDTLSVKHRDHALTGEFKGFRECHITPDWLLVYRKFESTLILSLLRTGTHSDLF